MGESLDQEIIAKSDADGDFVTGDDGFVVFWPEGQRGAFEAWHLRTIADELDRRNKAWTEHLEQYFQSVASTDTSFGECGTDVCLCCTSS